MNKYIRFLCDPHYRFNVLDRRGFYNKKADRAFLEKRFDFIFGYKLDFENPLPYSLVNSLDNSLSNSEPYSALTFPF